MIDCQLELPVLIILKIIVGPAKANLFSVKKIILKIIIFILILILTLIFLIIRRH